MKREEKAVAVAELNEKFKRARLAILTECTGMPVAHLTELRKQLRGVKAEYKVVKNTLANHTGTPGNNGSDLHRRILLNLTKFKQIACQNS